MIALFVPVRRPEGKLITSLELNVDEVDSARFVFEADLGVFRVSELCGDFVGRTMVVSLSTSATKELRSFVKEGTYPL